MAAAGAAAQDELLLQQLAQAALNESEEERALPVLSAASDRLNSARLWQWTGLLQRAIDEHESAIHSFERAAALAPHDPSIAHGRATVALEAGLDAVDLFENALRLAPTNGQIFLGLAAAKFAVGQGTTAAEELESALSRSPLWSEGHLQLANLRSMLGERSIATRSLERAISATPRAFALWKTLFDVRTSGADFTGLDAAVADALEAGQDETAVLPWQAIAAAELGETGKADALFAKLSPATRATMGTWYIRHLLRTGRAEAGVPTVEAGLRSSDSAAIWPYAATVWRLTGDKRWEWLERNGELTSVIDVTEDLPPLDQLSGTLRQLHVARGEYLDQSVRGGTQTDGPLFSRIDPVIRHLRTAVAAAVRRYVAQLPPVDPGHPLLSQRRDRKPRFSGSWSVRLRDGGRHTSHVHPQGWISSALYLALPPTEPGSEAGWLTLGAPPEELATGLTPLRSVEPRVGSLVLFPSWMWHGTVPFRSGERLTVAFDVRSAA